jgi:ABC-2 type transport system permease protein
MLEASLWLIDATPDGRYLADGDGAEEVNGFFQIHTSTADAPSPSGSSTTRSIR